MQKQFLRIDFLCSEKNKKQGYLVNQLAVVHHELALLDHPMAAQNEVYLELHLS